MKASTECAVARWRDGLRRCRRLRTARSALDILNSGSTWSFSFEMLGTCAEKSVTDPPSGQLQVPFHAQPDAAGKSKLSQRANITARGLQLTRSITEEELMLKFLGGTIGVIFIIGLLVVIGLLMLVF